MEQSRRRNAGGPTANCRLWVKSENGFRSNVFRLPLTSSFAHAAMTEVAPLSPDEVKAELARLTELAGVNLRPEVFEVLVELTRLDVVPTATAQVLKSLCVKSAMRASVGGSGGATAGDR